MEQWEFEFDWLRLRSELQQRFSMDKKPDLNAVLVLIGLQELGFSPPLPLSKEHKQDLMHVAVCTLLQEQGVFEPEGRDEEGWPHFRQVRAIEHQGEQAQEKLLIECTLNYFKKIEFLT